MKPTNINPSVVFTTETFAASVAAFERRLRGAKFMANVKAALAARVAKTAQIEAAYAQHEAQKINKNKVIVTVSQSQLETARTKAEVASKNALKALERSRKATEKAMKKGGKNNFTIMKAEKVAADKAVMIFEKLEAAVIVLEKAFKAETSARKFNLRISKLAVRAERKAAKATKVAKKVSQIAFKAAKQAAAISETYVEVVAA